jgi:hypothetical protein
MLEMQGRMTAKLERILVVMESGSEWPAWIDQCQSGASKRVIAQADGEPPEQLSDRVADCAEGAIQAPDAFELAVIACSERADRCALEARRAAASALLGVMARAQRGKLLLSLSCRSSGRARHAVSALASQLSQAWDGCGVEVSVRFGADAPAPAELGQHVA